MLGKGAGRTIFQLVLLATLDAGLALVVSSGSAKSRRWDVTMRRGDERHTLKVAEDEPLLAAAEKAGLLPSSECRRGNCLSCSARVIDGAPFSLRVEGCTALCEEAHAVGLVLMCSAYVVGPGVELELDYSGDAWELQHSTRWQSDAPSMPPQSPTPAHFRLPEDAVVFFERCRSLPDADDAAAQAADADAA